MAGSRRVGRGAARAWASLGRLPRLRRNQAVRGRGRQAPLRHSQQAKLSLGPDRPRRRSLSRELRVRGGNESADAGARASPRSDLGAALCCPSDPVAMLAWRFGSGTPEGGGRAAAAED